MTLEESIKYYEDKVEESNRDAELYKRVKATPSLIEKCEKCAEDSEQIVIWLKHYAEIEEIVKHWNDKDSHFTSAVMAFEKILDVFKE